MSLVARYEFNDPSTFTTDATGNGYTLTNVGPVGSIVDATYGTVASFTSVGNKHFSLTSAPSAITGSSSRTFSYWAKFTASGIKILHGQGSSSTTEYRAQTNNGPIKLIRGGVVLDTLNTPYQQWVHVSITYDGISESIYFDGVLDNSENISLNIETGPLWIGGSPRFPTSSTFLGEMLDFRVYDAALSSSDISTLYGSGPNPLPVNWVLDANSKYEISSREHLLQLMNEGTLYSNTGPVPTDWTSSDFIQTIDIDLLGDSTYIKPIGRDPIVGFRGEYDGNGFTISNWVYVDPNYPGASSDSGEYDRVGLFGSLQTTAVVKNVRMAGVCSISGFRGSCGFLAGGILQTTVVYNIEIDLSPGSFITQSNDSTNVPDIGGVLGSISGPGPFVAITLKGELEILTVGVNVGGIVGTVANANITLFRNLATFTSPLNGARVGGIVGRLRYSSVYKVMNAMTGDMNGTNTAGGIAGDARQNNSSQVFSEFVNSMRGTITGDSLSAYGGGVAGYLDQEPGGTVESLFNYMTGDILQPTNADRVGGLAGRGDTNTNMLTSLNAMNGSVRMPTVSDPSSGAEANINTSFGLTYEVDRNINTTPITGLPTDPNTGLPIFDLTATDPDGVVHTFDFVFGNLPREFNQLRIDTSGEYMNFAELQIIDMTGTNIALLGTASGSGGGNGGPSLGNDGGTDYAFSSDPLVNTVVDMYVAGGPVFWTLDLDRAYTLAEINKVVFHNRSGSVEELRAVGNTVSLYSADGGDPEQVGVLTSDLIQEFVITPAPEFLLPTPRVTSISVTVVEVTGATEYRITVTNVASDNTSVAHDSISTGGFVVRGLAPETNYILRLFANSGSGYELVDTESVYTLSNSAGNYDKTAFGSNGSFDLSELDTSSFALLGEVINDVFSTGERLEINLGTRTSKVSFVKRGETASTDDSILVPFDSASGSGQAFTMQLSDTSTVSVAYDETVNTLDIGGTTVQVGSSIVVDGKKLTVKDL